MVEAIREHSAGDTTLRRVRLVLFGRAAYDTFVETAQTLIGQT